MNDLVQTDGRISHMHRFTQIRIRSVIIAILSVLAIAAAPPKHKSEPTVIPVTVTVKAMQQAQQRGALKSE